MNSLFQMPSPLLQTKDLQVVLQRCFPLQSSPWRRASSIDVFSTQLQHIDPGDSVARTLARRQGRRAVSQYALGDHAEYREGPASRTLSFLGKVLRSAPSASSL